MSKIDELLKKKEKTEERLSQLAALVQDTKKKEANRVSKTLGRAIKLMQNDASIDQLLTLLDPYVIKPSDRKFLNLSPLKKRTTHTDGEPNDT